MLAAGTRRARDERKRNHEGGAQMSTAATVRASPEGVPGALTDPSAVLAEDLTFAGAGGEQINGYLARSVEPSADAPTRHSAIIVIHEAGGLGEHIRDVTNRFANVGYLALGVDLYTREGGPPPMDDLQAMMERLFSISDATVLGDLEGAAAYLRSRPDCDGKVGCIGFCMGGRYTLLFACSSDRLDAAVDCWGGFIDTATLEDRTTASRPKPPLELAGDLRCPLFAAIGAEDHNPSPEVGEQLCARAAGSPVGSAGGEVTVEVFAGAGHAFFADYRPSYRPGPAAELWRQVVPFFASHLDGA
jgi:carboxymethylenebutenolidase